MNYLANYFLAIKLRKLMHWMCLPEVVGFIVLLNNSPYKEGGWGVGRAKER